MQQAKINKTCFDNTINARQLAFKDLKQLAAKDFNSLNVSGVTALAIADEKPSIEKYRVQK